ncbi:conserved hypothetical protein [Formosa agariphila KMM 3901]|uniref:Uncharacterized protein n=1 Tax=Formosa agariphila (strain DSM 15362 / KCTC 12365 / LMG 23005 / KMM 3901 / M-2Alg 35-1) TaxID=1347342 RepID=T2KLG0_FORAG|nr:hypothetical protein [Formosa agariphila]CDF78809.1 conserved hypothetical protein [Formosa agariphila KMM 3901]
MVLNNIEELLEKYENGETTLQEEAQLKAYFSQEHIAPHLELYRPLFAYFKANKTETYTKEIPLKSKKTPIYSWLSVAAIAILMLGFYFNSTQIITSNEDDLGTIQDPELAYNEVVKSLELISKSLNKGASTVSYLKSYNKGIATVGYIAELEQSSNIIFKNTK